MYMRLLVYLSKIWFFLDLNIQLWNYLIMLIYAKAGIVFLFLFFFFHFLKGISINGFRKSNRKYNLFSRIFILRHFCLISSRSKHLAPCLMQIQDTTGANKYTKKLQTIHYRVILFDWSHSLHIRGLGRSRFTYFSIK